MDFIHGARHANADVTTAMDVAGRQYVVIVVKAAYAIPDNNKVPRPILPPPILAMEDTFVGDGEALPEGKDPKKVQEELRRSEKSKVGQQKGGFDREAMMKRFDKDGDGKLSESERAEMQKSFKGRQKGGKGGKGGGEGGRPKSRDGAALPGSATGGALAMGHALDGIVAGLKRG